MVTRNYTIAWFGMMLLAIINGALRDFGYKPYVGELAAHQLSTLILVILLIAYAWFLTRLWPLRSATEARTIGIVWFLMTEGFEFGAGLSRGISWREMFDAYNIVEGRLWLIVPIIVLISPAVFYHLANSRRTNLGSAQKQRGVT